MTGRLSSKAPNLQNIPVRDDMGKAIRKFFVARDDEHILVGADYSQIELRVLASMAGDEAMIQLLICENDRDKNKHAADNLSVVQALVKQQSSKNCRKNGIKSVRRALRNGYKIATS